MRRKQQAHEKRKKTTRNTEEFNIDRIPEYKGATMKRQCCNHLFSSLALLTIYSSHNTPYVTLLGPLNPFVDSFALLSGPAVSSRNHNKRRLNQNRPLFSEVEGRREADGSIQDGTSNVTSIATEIECKETETKIGYQPIEEWHEQTKKRDSAHVIRHLKQEKAVWKKTFDDAEKRKKTTQPPKPAPPPTNLQP